MNKSLTILDGLVIFLILPAFCLPFLAFLGNAHFCAEWLAQHNVLLNIVGISSCLVLFIWMLFNGQESVLWKWFPPFCFFPKAKWIKWSVVIAMITGTILGIFC
jgi:hypothetical protein